MAITILFTAPSFAMSGGTWYENCSKWAYSKKAEIAALPVEKRLAYRECQIEAIKVWCDREWEGDVTKVADRLISQGQTNEQVSKKFEEALSPYCPNFFIMPFAGPAAVAVEQIEKQGGPGYLDRWLPASKMLERVFNERFPRCTQQRKSLGLVADTSACFDNWFKNIDR